jgi:hypothetical protein
MSKLSIVLPKGFIGPWFAACANRLSAEPTYEDESPSSKRDCSGAGERSARRPGRAALGSCLSDLSTRGLRTWN